VDLMEEYFSVNNAKLYAVDKIYNILPTAFSKHYYTSNHFPTSSTISTTSAKSILKHKKQRKSRGG